MEEGLKVILSADVSQFEAAFARATQATGRSIQLINSNLKGAEGGFSALASTTNKLIPSWQKFSSIFMNPFMREFGGHTKEMMGALSEAHTRIQQGTMTMSQLLQVTQFTGKEMEGLGAKLASIPVDHLESGLDKASKTLLKFADGKRPMADLKDAIERLQASLPGMGNTQPVEKLILSLQQLQATGKGMNIVGLDIKPEVHVADTLRDIEQVKGLIGSQQFHFKLSADARGLNQAMQAAVNTTEAATEAIEHSCEDAGAAFVQMSKTASGAVVEYVRALGQLNTVPKAVKTTVEAPDMTPVIEAVRQVKAEIAQGIKSPVATLPKLTLSADTTPFTNALLSTKTVSQETWAAIRQTFTGVDKAIAEAADKARISVQQIVQNFNALKGVGPEAVVMQVKPPNYAPVIAAAKVAKRNIDQVFLTPLPQLKAPTLPVNNSIQQFSRQLHDTTGVGLQFNQLLREMPNFAIDARIGVMSLSNNLPYFVDALQNARRQGKGFTDILGTLGSSIFSVSGIALIAVTAFTYFAGRMSKSKDEAKSAAQQMEDYVESLDALNKARLKGEQNGYKELVNLKLLYDATQNHALALNDRKKAVDALQQQYPQYFKNLSDEIILAGGARNAYDQLTNAILRKAKAESAQEELKTLTSAERTLRDQRRTSAQQFFDAATILKRATEQYKQASERGDPQVITYLTQMQVAQRKYNEARAAALGMGLKIAGNLADQEKLVKEIASYGIDAIIPDPEPIRAKADTKDAEDAFAKLAAYVKEINLKATVDIDATPVIKEPTNWVGEYQESLKQQFEKEIEASVTINLTPEQIKANALTSGVDKVFTDMLEKFRDAKVAFPKIDLSQFVKEGGAAQLLALLSKILSQTVDFRTKMQNIMSSAAVDSVAGFAEGIGEALAGGNLGKAFENVLNVLGSAIQQLGKELIASSSIIQSFKKALNSLIANPVAGIAVGAAMVAVGAAIKSSASKFPKFADGGVVFGPTFGLMGEYAGASSNPEVIAPLSKLKDLIGGVGGDKFPAYLPMHSIKGSELKLWYARAERQGNRYS